jgi:hypothetical protein
MSQPKDLNKIRVYAKYESGREYYAWLIEPLYFNKSGFGGVLNPDETYLEVDGYLYTPSQVVTAMNRFRKNKRNK